MKKNQITENEKKDNTVGSLSTKELKERWDNLFKG